MRWDLSARCFTPGAPSPLGRLALRAFRTGELSVSPDGRLALVSVGFPAAVPFETLTRIRGTETPVPSFRRAILWIHCDALDFAESAQFVPDAISATPDQGAGADL
jgi:hypothetical protein